MRVDRALRVARRPRRVREQRRVVRRHRRRRHPASARGAGRVTLPAPVPSPGGFPRARGAGRLGARTGLVDEVLEGQEGRALRCGADRPHVARDRLVPHAAVVRHPATEPADDGDTDGGVGHDLGGDVVPQGREGDEGDRTGILQVVAELAGRVHRVDGRTHRAQLPRREDADDEQRIVLCVDRDAITRGDAFARESRSERPRLRVDLTEREGVREGVEERLVR